MRFAWLLGLVGILACGGTAEKAAADAASTTEAAHVVLDPAAAELPSGSTVTVMVRGGDPHVDLDGGPESYTIRRGGGHLSGTPAQVAWTLGKAPVLNSISYMSWIESADVRATLAQPYAATPFGDVHDYLTAQKNDGSTEDCAFSPDGKLMMGVPGGLVTVSVDGKTSAVPATGDALVAPLGLIYDAQGTLWIADSKGHALRSFANGAITTVLTTDGVQNLSMPNDVATLGKTVYLTDSCLGEVMSVQDGKVTSLAKFDLAKEGGANGLAVDPSGKALWVTTENTGLLCSSKGVDLEAPIGGLYRYALNADGTLGARTDVAVGQALFGDGLTFDSEDNLYVIFDTEKDFQLQESAVWVMAAGDTKLVKFLAASDRVFANPVFGQGAYGKTQLYLALLAVPVFTPPESRGLMRFDVGIAGRGL